jgi:AAA domain
LTDIKLAITKEVTTIETVQVTESPNAPSVLLLGEMGSGKTTALRSLIDLGFEVFMVPTEPGFQDIVGDIPNDKLKWHYVPSFLRESENVKEGHTFDVLLDAAKLINTNHHDTIQKMGGINKQNHQQIWDLISTCNNFVDDRSGKSYGDVATWDNNRVLFVDGLSGIKEMAIRNTIGDKPFMELRDYSAVQFLIRQFVNGLCSRTKAMFVLTAHLERETDPNTGAYKLMVSVPGKALAPELPRFFSDSIHCKLEITGNVPKWTWNTVSNEVTVKSRNLPMAVGQAPTFKALVENWRKRVGVTV